MTECNQVCYPEVTKKDDFTSSVIARNNVTKQANYGVSTKRHNLLCYEPNENGLPRWLPPPRSDEKLMNRIASPH